MKYLALLFLFLGACASKPITKEYDCTIFNGHGVYARMKVNAIDQENATLTASEVASRLINKGLVPDTCTAICYRNIQQYPKGK